MNNHDATPADLGRHHKIQPGHWQRLAYIYIRQSSVKQITDHPESQVYQRHLAQRAEALGWPAARIRIIDTDLGQSAKEGTSRTGFQELITEMSLGHVGIIFGYQVSRLARNNRDWYHLLDLAAVFDTLIADIDGIYDPRSHNDRLLLGLKGTMSEAELHLLQQRLTAGRLSKIRRGIYRQRLPTGLVRLADGTVVKEPDDQVRHAIELVFATFDQVGSCRQVVRYLRQGEMLLPRRQAGGPFAGQLLWKQPAQAAVQDILTNPAYAGAFAYGRIQLDPTRRRPGQPVADRVAKPISEWIHLQQDVYPAYISWSKYLANQEKIRQNGTHWTEKILAAQGPTRCGAALLQGMAVCGQCGHRLYIAYKRTPRYLCQALRDSRGKVCMSLHGPSIDAAVVQAFFEAIRPAQLDALEPILAQQQAEHQRLVQQWQERLKRAQYEVHLAQRQFDAVDPDNRLVAAELERRWEAKLHQLQTVREAYEKFQAAPLSLSLPPKLRQQLQHISDTLPQLWPTLANSQKKELLRSLIARVIVKRVAPDKVEAKIIWISGHYSIVHALPPFAWQRNISGYDQMVERIKQLWQEGHNDPEIADQLTQEGFRSAHSTQVLPSTIIKIRLAHDWRSPRDHLRNKLEIDGQLTVRGLMARFKVSKGCIHGLIRDEIIAPQFISRDRQSGFYLIKKDPILMAQLEKRYAKRLAEQD